MLFTDSSFRVNKLCFSSFPYHGESFHNSISVRVAEYTPVEADLLATLGRDSTRRLAD